MIKDRRSGYLLEREVGKDGTTNALCEVLELARLHFHRVVVVHDIVVRLQPTMMEVRICVYPGVVVVSESRTCDAVSRTTRHVVEEGI